MEKIGDNYFLYNKYVTSDFVQLKIKTVSNNRSLLFPSTNEKILFLCGTILMVQLDFSIGYNIISILNKDDLFYTLCRVRYTMNYKYKALDLHGSLISKM